jgi:uncharacterized protein YraI
MVVMQLSATPTRLPSVTPTPTHTPFVIVSPTPGATLDTQEAVTVQPANCSAVVTNNLNLRGGPGLDYQLLLTIPHNTVLTVGDSNEDSTWWQVSYNGNTGWVKGEYLNFYGDCPDAPAAAVPPILSAEPVCHDCETNDVDTRINPGAAEAAIYCTATGVKIVDLDISGVSTDSFTVPYTAIQAIGVSDENRLIREYRGFRLYRLTTGEWQLNAPPNWRDAGEYIFTWAGCDKAAQ